MSLTWLPLSLALSSLLTTQCSAFVIVSPVLYGRKPAPTVVEGAAARPQFCSRYNFKSREARRQPLGMSSTDGDAITRARAKLVESPQLDELMLLLRDHGRSDSDFFEPSDHEKEKEEGTDEDSPPDGSTEEADADAEDAAPPAEPAAETTAVETRKEEAKQEELSIEVGTGGEQQHDVGLGAGGMADTRDPNPMDHADPRKSISAAPTFEEYLKARSSA